MKFSQFIQNLSGFAINVTKKKYSISVTSYDLLSNKVYFVHTWVAQSHYAAQQSTRSRKIDLKSGQKTKNKLQVHGWYKL